MKRKPTLKQLKKRSAIWFDGNDLRLTFSDKDQKQNQTCSCKICVGNNSSNSWWYDVKSDNWWTSFWTREGSRREFEFVGWV
jgi:hypothetical protein